VVIFIFYLFSDLPHKKIAIFMKKNNLFSLFLFHPPLHHGMVLQGRQNITKINVFGPVSEQNFIPE
jgi:hypothetical protein